jgi:hypothetical protein
MCIGMADIIFDNQRLFRSIPWHKYSSLILYSRSQVPLLGNLIKRGPQKSDLFTYLSFEARVTMQALLGDLESFACIEREMRRRLARIIAGMLKVHADVIRCLSATTCSPNNKSFR